MSTTSYSVATDRDPSSLHDFETLSEALVAAVASLTVAQPDPGPLTVIRAEGPDDRLILTPLCVITRPVAQEASP